MAFLHQFHRNKYGQNHFMYINYLIEPYHCYFCIYAYNVYYVNHL